MSKKPRTPADIAKAELEKKTYSFSLIELNMEELKKLAEAEDVPVSKLIDEAILWYLKAIKEN